MKEYVPISTLIKVYNAIILSHFDYCSLVWDECADYLLTKLQKLQNRAARVITGSSYEAILKFRRHTKQIKLAAFERAISD